MAEASPNPTHEAVPADPEADATAVIGILTGGWAAQTLRAVADLRIADHLAAGPLTADEVAEREGSHPGSTYRLMRAAASLGVLDHRGERRFGLTGRGELLREDVPGSLRALVLVQNERVHWQSWGLFPDAVRKGASQTERAVGAPLFDYFARPENFWEAQLFARAMGDLSGLVTQGAVAAVDTADVSTVVDVGGADGDFLLGLMAADPRLTGQVLDLPHAVEGARREAAKRGLESRFTTVAGDFFDAVPAADLYLLKMIMHDWNDEQCIRILSNCRAAATGARRALVAEMVVGEIGTPDFATLVDMNMLNVANGMERELAEYDALFAASGWRRTSAYPVGGGYSVLELHAV